jgi:nucleotide-binding universal stress UspA family protein
MTPGVHASSSLEPEVGPILLAYDGSESAATAIAVAGGLLADRQAVVCHAWSGLSRAVLRADKDELPGVLRDAAEQLDAEDRAAAEQTAADGARLAGEAGFEARPLAPREERKTWRTLLEAADDVDASVVVAGAHGLSGVGRAVLGSVSTGLLHHSRRPVLVVPATAMGETCDGPLLLCYDGSDAAERAIGLAGSLCAPRAAVVLNVWESWAAEVPALAGLSGTVAGMARELDEIADEESTGCTSGGVNVAEQAGFEVSGLSERATGPVWSTVLEIAAEHDCSAIVVGSRGLTGISAALGSVSNGVVHHSRGPVLVVPAETAP